MQPADHEQLNLEERRAEEVHWTFFLKHSQTQSPALHIYFRPILVVCGLVVHRGVSTTSFKDMSLIFYVLNADSGR